MKNLFSFLISHLNENQSNFFYFIPVFYGIGVGIYFALPFEPDLYATILALCSSIFGYFLLSKNNHIKIFAQITIISLLGFTITNLHTIARSSEEFDYNDQFVIVNAEVVNIQKTQDNYRVIFKNLDFKNLEYFTNSFKIRVRFKNIPDNLNEGDIVDFKAILSKPAESILPDHFNFARYAFFENIKAVGYAVSNLKIIKNTTNISYLAKLRQHMLKTIHQTLDQVNGSIASALIIGEYSQLPRNILDEMRISGLAHILSVSGLHMTVISGIFFFLCRQILAFSNTLALNFNLKKIASITAIIGGYFYLLLTGLQIAAIRSYIMTSLFLFAILIDRIQIGMRSIAIAALLLLVFWPEYIIHPSFQMSFAAVLALISVYELLAQKNIFFKHQNFVLNIILSGVSLLFTSLVASLAIAPFAAYHFNQASYYSMLANLFAVPLISIYVMPLMIISMFLYPFGAMHYPLNLADIGISYVVKISSFVAKLPHSYSTIRHLDTYSFIIIIIGGLWFLLWQSRSRYLGFVVIIIGIINAYLTPLPDVIIDQKGAIILKDNNNRVIFFDTIYSRIKKDIYSKYFGYEKGITLREYFYNDLDFTCDPQMCVFNIRNKHVAIIQGENLTCPNVDVIIAVKLDYTPCKAQLVITKANLQNQGSHLLFIKSYNANIYLQTTNSSRTNRLWSIKN